MCDNGMCVTKWDTIFSESVYDILKKTIDFGVTIVQPHTQTAAAENMSNPKLKNAHPHVHRLDVYPTLIWCCLASSMVLRAQQ